MERKIGEIFTCGDKTYQVVKSILCTHCAFNGKLCGLIGPSAGNCMPNSRSDNTSVIFKESILWNTESWRHSISRCQIIKWAYLSDILPEKGDEQ